MKKIIRHIEYLMMTHDCVVIPGVGAILAHGKEARYVTATGRYEAPRRVFAFNPDLTHDDGLLAGSIARRDGVSLSSANDTVAAAAEAMQRVLQGDGHVSLGRVGILKRHAGGRLQFVPGPEVSWLSPAVMWLPSIEVQTLELPSEVHRSAVRSDWSARLRRVGSRAAVAAACAAVVLGLGWTVGRNSGLLPEMGIGAQRAAVAPLAKEIQAPAPAAPILILATAPADEVIENAPAAEPAEQPYVLVVASFNTEAEARRFMARNSDANLSLLPKDNRWRVYAAQGQTPADVVAQSKEPSLAQRFASSWVCRR